MAWFRLPRSFRTYLIVELIITVTILTFSTSKMIRVDASDPRSTSPSSMIGNKPASGATASALDDPALDTAYDNYFEVSPENKRIIIEQARASLLKVLGLKEAPKSVTSRQKKNRKAIVPHAMFEEYRKLRDSVREYIPDDRDFYGKINVHDMEKRHVDFWNVVYNKYPGYDIEIDMSDSDGDGDGETTSFLYKGDYERLSNFKPQSEPEDVPKKFEYLLPPHSSGRQKSYSSVHMKFNLSQEFFINPITADDLQAAELHLSRERVTAAADSYYNNESQETRDAINEDRLTMSVQDHHHHTIGSSSGDGTQTLHAKTAKSHHNNKQLPNRTPRYQRLYILHVLGYDQHNEPITRIHDSQLIDTHRTTPLMLDISHIVKRWITNPKDNYGIIVRVTNDDKSYDKERTRFSEPQQVTTAAPPALPTADQNSVAVETTNASNTTTTTSPSPDNNNKNKPQIVAPDPPPPPPPIMDHVRLKREFRSTSEIDDIWQEKQPSIYVFSSPPGSSRRHVKRTTGPSNAQTGTVRSTSRNKPTQRKNARTPEKCSRKSLQINFDEVGWSSWIIAPNSYYANYCQGDCSYPMNDNQNASNHAIIQSIFYSVGHRVLKSCCAPTKLSKMAILYQLDGNVQMKNYDDMVVESCGCT